MNNSIKIPDWISDGPMDFEYKSYRMFSKLELLGKKLKTGNLLEVLIEVDLTLDYLYRYDADKLTSTNDLTNYDLIGVDWQNFALEFADDPDIERDDIMDNLCDLAIDKYEDLHSKIRNIWREIEEGLTISYVPQKPYFVSDGFVFIITPDNMLHTYYFYKPSKYFVEDWKGFKLELIQSEKYSKEKYFKHIEELINSKSDKLIFKVTCNNNILIENNSIAVIQQKIYNRLKHDFTF